MWLVRIDVPDTLPIEEIDSLPADPQVFRQLGDEWLQHNGTPVLRVPSVLVPHAWNILLNPRHPEVSEALIETIEPFGFDPRLWRPLAGEG